MDNCNVEFENILQNILAKLNGDEDENPMKNVASYKAEEVVMGRTCNLTEFVGATHVGNTIGLVIANVDGALREMMGLGSRFNSIGIVGSRTGAGPQIFAADEAIKATDAKIVSIELPRDAKAGAGQGSLIIIGGDDVSSVRSAVEITLKETETRTFGDVYTNDVGHVELQYTARAGEVCNKAWNVPIGKACGMVVGAPAAIGIVMADVAMKSANIEIVGYRTPVHGQNLANEVALIITGTSGAVREAVISAREVGNKLLCTLGSTPSSIAPSYIR